MSEPKTENFLQQVGFETSEADERRVASQVRNGADLWKPEAGKYAFVVLPSMHQGLPAMIPFTSGYLSLGKDDGVQAVDLASVMEQWAGVEAILRNESIVGRYDLDKTLAAAEAVFGERAVENRTRAMMVVGVFESVPTFAAISKAGGVIPDSAWEACTFMLYAAPATVAQAITEFGSQYGGPVSSPKLGLLPMLLDREGSGKTGTKYKVHTLPGCTQRVFPPENVAKTMLADAFKPGGALDPIVMLGNLTGVSKINEAGVGLSAHEALGGGTLAGDALTDFTGG